MNKRILVADDYEDSANAMAVLFRLSGNDVRVANNGAEAISIAEEFRPDFILMDVAMPEMDGYDVCQHIRQQPWGTDILLAAMTGWSGEQFRERAMESGFDYFLVKPIETDAVDLLLAGTKKSEQ